MKFALERCIAPSPQITTDPNTFCTFTFYPGIVGFDRVIRTLLPNHTAYQCTNNDGTILPKGMVISLTPNLVKQNFLSKNKGSLESQEECNLDEDDIEVRLANILHANWRNRLGVITKNSIYEASYSESNGFELRERNPRNILEWGLQRKEVPKNHNRNTYLRFGEFSSITYRGKEIFDPYFPENLKTYLTLLSRKVEELFGSKGNIPKTQGRLRVSFKKSCDSIKPQIVTSKRY